MTIEELRLGLKTSLGTAVLVTIVNIIMLQTLPELTETWIFGLAASTLVTLFIILVYAGLYYPKKVDKKYEKAAEELYDEETE